MLHSICIAGSINLSLWAKLMYDEALTGRFDLFCGHWHPLNSKASAHPVLICERFRGVHIHYIIVFSNICRHVNCVKWLLVQGALIDEENTKNMTAKKQVEDKIAGTERKKEMAKTILCDNQAALKTSQPKGDGQSLHRTESKIEKEKAHDQSTIQLTLERYEHLLRNLKNVKRALDEGAVLEQHNLLSIEKLKTLDLKYDSKEVIKKEELDRINFQLQGPTSVSTVTISAGGSGYTSAPTVVFTGGGGSGASATAVVTNSAVTSITMNSEGSGYTSSPTVSFTGGGGGTGAAASAVMHLKRVESWCQFIGNF